MSYVAARRLCVYNIDALKFRAESEHCAAVSSPDEQQLDAATLNASKTTEVSACLT